MSGRPFARVVETYAGQVLIERQERDGVPLLRFRWPDVDGVEVVTIWTGNDAGKRSWKAADRLFDCIDEGLARYLAGEWVPGDMNAFRRLH